MVLICFGQENFNNNHLHLSLPIDSSALIAYYPLDGHAMDVGSHSHHGKIFGAEPIKDRSGRAEGAMHFDGRDDYIDLGNSKKLKPDFPITIVAWVRFDRFWGNFFFTNNYDEDYYNGIWVGAGMATIGYPRMKFGNGGLTTILGGKEMRGQDTLILNRWYHYVAVFKATNDLVLYINGEKVPGNYRGFATTLTYTDGPAIIGKKDTNYDAPPWYFEGAVDDLILFARALSDEEIKTLYEN